MSKRKVKSEKINKEKQKELQALADKLSGVFLLGKDTYKIKRRDNVKRTRSSKKS
jgi:aminoglycoside phosphotransferase family enzyme